MKAMDSRGKPRAGSRHRRAIAGGDELNRSNGAMGLRPFMAVRGKRGLRRTHIAYQWGESVLAGDARLARRRTFPIVRTWH
jgi:hypothetical protein